MSENKVLSKEGLLEAFDWDEEEYNEFKKEGLLPDYSRESEEKFSELMERGEPFSYNELVFLGSLNLKDFQKRYPAEAEEYMNL